MRRAIAISLLLLSVSLAADQPPAQPTLEPAQAAIRKAQTSEKITQETYDAAMFKARKAEIDELRIAQKIATKYAELDEANAIAAKIKSVQSEMGGAATSPAADMFGAWKTQYEGRDIKWTITPKGVTHDEAGNQTGVPEVKGDVMAIKWPSGMVDRLTFVDARFFVETWLPGNSTSGPPQNVAVGTRDSERK